MGLKVTTDMAVFKDKTLVGYDWNHGNEYIVFLEDKEGYVERVRVPAYMAKTFEWYWSVTQADNYTKAA